jgi:hypothetical protein
MTDVIAVIADMSWWVKGAWLVWLAWLAVQVAWYQLGRAASSEKVASARPERVNASRVTPVSTTPQPPGGAGHAGPSSPRRRRRPRQSPAVTTDFVDGVEAAR